MKTNGNHWAPPPAKGPELAPFVEDHNLVGRLIATGTLRLAAPDMPSWQENQGAAHVVLVLAGMFAAALLGCWWLGRALGLLTGGA